MIAWPVQFTIPGPPRTKKNHGSVVQRGRRKIHLPSPQYLAWDAAAQIHLIALKVRITEPVNCCALFYRDRDAGDAVGYYQALADTLQNAHIVENDRLIVSWDGSRLLKDAANPRVEFTLEPVG